MTTHKTLYILAVLFMVLWVVGYIGYNIGGPIHLLLVLAVMTLVVRFRRRKIV